MSLIDLTLMLFGSKHTKQTPADRMTDLIMIGNVIKVEEMIMRYCSI